MPIPVNVAAGACTVAEPKTGTAEVVVAFGVAPAPKANMLVPDPLNAEVGDCNNGAEACDA